MKALKNSADILDLIAQDKWMLGALTTLQSLNLPDWWIGAGFVRNKVWDYLHGFAARTPYSDIDGIYFDPAGLSSEIEIQNRLISLKPEYQWEITNQGTVHVSNSQSPYKNSIDALSRWTETATCVAVSLNASMKLELAAPYGVDDLLNLVVRKTPHSEAKPDVFANRIRNKGWFEKWPRLKLI